MLDNFSKDLLKEMVQTKDNILLTIENQIQIWDAETYKLLEEYGDGDWTECISASQNSDRIISGVDKSIKIWDTATGNLLNTLSGHSDKINCLAFSDDGQKIVSGSRETIKIWDAITGILLKTLDGNEYQYGINHIAFSPDCTKIISSDWNGNIVVWDANSGQIIHTMCINECNSLIFSPDDQKVVSGGRDKIKIWDTNTGELINTFEGHHGHTTSLVYTPDNLKIISGYDHQCIDIWDAVSGDVIHTLHGHTNDVKQISVSPDNQKILSCSSDEIILWCIETGVLLHTIVGEYLWASFPSFRDDGIDYKINKYLEESNS